MNKKRRKAVRKPQPSSVWKSALIALPITVAVALLLLLLSTLALLCTKDPIRYKTVFGVAVFYLCGAIGGFICTRLCGRQFPLLSGLLVGGGLWCLFALPALLIPGEVSKLAGLLLRAPILMSALGGAMLGCREKKRRGRR